MHGQTYNRFSLFFKSNCLMPLLRSSSPPPHYFNPVTIAYWNVFWFCEIRSKWSNCYGNSSNSISVSTAHSDSSVLTRRQKQCAQKPNTNIFNVSTFCEAKDCTGQSGMCGEPQGATTHLHEMWLSNCELRQTV